jgi:hypothetical protein
VWNLSLPFADIIRSPRITCVVQQFPTAALLIAPCNVNEK